MRGKFRWAKLAFLAIIGSIWLAGPAAANSPVSTRVERAKLLFGELEKVDDINKLTPEQRLLAQWGNWGNWGNWLNWNDWNKWRDWGNGWTNFVNG